MSTHVAGGPASTVTLVCPIRRQPPTARPTCRMTSGPRAHPRSRARWLRGTTASRRAQMGAFGHPAAGRPGPRMRRGAPGAPGLIRAAPFGVLAAATAAARPPAPPETEGGPRRPGRHGALRATSASPKPSRFRRRKRRGAWPSKNQSLGHAAGPKQVPENAGPRGHPLHRAGE